MSDRIKAFLIHLGISLIILAVLLYVVVYIWYPPPFFAADGGWQGVRLIASVDIVLGPLLTLFVFNPKKGAVKLRRDLLIIAIVQFSSLTAGCWIVADQRTAMVVFANNRFVSMNQSQVIESEVSKQMLESLKTSHPPMAYVDLPDDKNARDQLIMSNLDGKPLFKRGELYQPLTLENRLKIVDEGFDIDAVSKLSDEHSKIVQDFLNKHQAKAEHVVALPLYCRYGDLALVLNRDSGEIIDTLDVKHEQLLASLTKISQKN